MNNQSDQDSHPPLSDSAANVAEEKPALPQNKSIGDQSRFNGALSIARLGAFEWDLKTDDVFLDGRSPEIFDFAADTPV